MKNKIDDYVYSAGKFGGLNQVALAGEIAETAHGEVAATLAWSGLKRFRVIGIRDESDTVRSFWLAPGDGSPLPRFRPGQYIPLRSVPVGGGRPLTRTYSLSAAPGDSRAFRISIKREEGALNGILPLGVFSNYMHDTMTMGAELLVGAPRGSFVLDAAGDAPVCFLSAGVGVTPVFSMLEHLVNTDDRRSVCFIHGTRNGRLHTFREDLRRMTANRPWITSHVYYSRPSKEDAVQHRFDSVGRIDLTPVLALDLPKDTHYFLCGPLGFLRDLYQGLRRRGVDEGRLHYEHFGTAVDLAIDAPERAKPKEPPITRPRQTGETATVTFASSGIVVEWDGSVDSILELAEAVGIFAMYSCRSGVCQTCSCQLQDGAVEYFNDPAADPEPGEVLICSTRPKGNIVIDL